MKIDPTAAPYSDVINALLQHQGDLSDTAFAKRWLSVSPTTWLRVRTGEYAADDHTPVWQKLQNDLRALQEHELITQGRESEILPLEHIKLALQSLNMAFAESRNRLVVILSETGGGKTTITRAIEREYPGRVARTEATEPWRNSYLAGIHAIADSCGLEGLPNNTRVAEDRLFRYLKNSPRIIVIDEGNYFGPATLNLVKAILNQTASIVVITSLPILWERMKASAWQETRQLRNRTAALIEFKSVTQRDVRALMESMLPNWHSLGTSERSAVASVQKAANAFGLWNTVKSIADSIADTCDGTITLDQVERSISDVAILRR